MIKTNMTKEDLQKLKENDPFIKMASMILGDDDLHDIIRRVEKEIDKKSEEKSAKENNIYFDKFFKADAPKPTQPTSIFNSVKVDKDKFSKFIDAFAQANDTVAALEDNGFMFTEDSPIVQYENLIAGLLKSIFGKEVQEDICAYAYGDSNIQLEDLWNKITKKINF